MDEIVINITEVVDEVAINVVEIVEDVTVNVSELVKWGEIIGDISLQQDLMALIAGAVPNVGVNRVAYGHPTTGVLTSSGNMLFVDQVSGFPGRAYMTVADALIGNISGYSIVRATQHVSPGDMEITAANGAMYFYTGAGSLRGAIDQVSGAWKILPGSLSSDMMLRVDDAGVRIGPRSSMNTTNSYPFEVYGTGGTSIRTSASGREVYLGTDYIILGNVSNTSAFVQTGAFDFRILGWNSSSEININRNGGLPIHTHTATQHVFNGTTVIKNKLFLDSTGLNNVTLDFGNVSSPTRIESWTLADPSLFISSQFGSAIYLRPSYVTTVTLSSANTLISNNLYLSSPGAPLWIDSTNGNSAKIVLKDIGVHRSSFGCDVSNLFTILDNLGNIMVTVTPQKILRALYGLNVAVTEYADNTAAALAGLVVGDVYRTGEFLKIRY